MTTYTVAGSFVPAVSELALILFLKRRLQDELLYGCTHCLASVLPERIVWCDLLPCDDDNGRRIAVRLLARRLRFCPLSVELRDGEYLFKGGVHLEPCKACARPNQNRRA
jgi:hypothetical protein